MFISAISRMFIVSALGGIIGYSILFVSMLQIKFLRHRADSEGREKFLVTEVIFGTLTLVVTVTAIVFLYIDRALAGRFFLIATVFGLPLLAQSIIERIEVYKPPKGLGKYYGVGLIIGNITVFLANFAAFYLNVPSP